jgi:hypothetical protein
MFSSASSSNGLATTGAPWKSAVRIAGQNDQGNGALTERICHRSEFPQAGSSCDVLVAGEAAIDRLPQAKQPMPAVLAARPSVGLRRHGGEAESVVQVVGEQPTFLRRVTPARTAVEGAAEGPPSCMPSRRRRFSLVPMPRAELSKSA